jgi:pimeloyl-ACP methyl ester carboxylesterase
MAVRPIKDAELATIKAPVAVVVGEHDEAIRPEHTEAIAKAIPGAKLVILPGVSQFAMLQDTDGYNKAIREFLGAN